MASINGRVYVDDPTSTTVRYGLFSVVPPESMDDHVSLGGIQYLTGDCGPDHTLTVACGPTATKTFDAGPTTITGDPFVVYGTMTCGIAGYTTAEYEAWLRRRFTINEQAFVELAFSTQANGQAPGLANNPSAATLTAATGVTAAISTLEGWLYQTTGYDKRGILHIPIVAAAFLREGNAMTMDSQGIWRTAIGTAISFGNYAGALPNGTGPAAGHTTIYITGQMGIWRNEILVPSLAATISKPSNQYNALAERTYVLSLECGVAGVDTTLAP